MTTIEKIDYAIALLHEIKSEITKTQTQPITEDSGGSNPPGTGQPGKP